MSALVSHTLDESRNQSLKSDTINSLCQNVRDVVQSANLLHSDDAVGDELADEVVAQCNVLRLAVETGL